MRTWAYALAVISLCGNTEVYSGGKHHKKEKRHERRSETDCDDEIVFEGPRNPEEIWFDNDGEFESSRKSDHCKRKERERQKERQHHKKHKHKEHRT